MNEDLLTLIGTVLGGTFIANLVANRKYTHDDKQEIINQLQEERTYYAAQIQEERTLYADQQRIRDSKIDELYDLYREMETRNREIIQEKMGVEWERDRLRLENDDLKRQVTSLEQRVTDLEREEKKTWKKL